MVQGLTIENPLLEGLPDEKRPDPFAMVIFGAHGDLTKRKLIPAIYALYVQNLLPENFAIVGTSRTEKTDEEFRDQMRESVIKYGEGVTLENASWERFSKSLYYRPGNAKDAASYADLKTTLDELKEKHGTQGHHIFYLSTSPSLYSPIIENLARAGLATKRKTHEPAWPRIVVEKPFGHDLKSARELDERLHDVLREHQIYRIDHYLGKETVQNIMCFRFANSIFEPLWTREFIDHIQITNAETLGVEDRGAYYEEAGAIRDMMQNHLMQLVALVLMEPPISLDPESTRDERIKVLKAIRPFTRETVDYYVVRGQYGKGFILGNQVTRYRDEPNVAPDSTTDTFAAMKLHVDNWRWADVPIYLRSGKRLPKRITEIAITFKRPPHRLFQELGGSGWRRSSGEDSPNVLVLRIQPDEGISLKFATKQPGMNTTLRVLNMDFRYGTAFGDKAPSAYERLILDCMIGDPSLYSRSDFVEESWKLFQPILDRWSTSQPEEAANGHGITHRPFPNYESGSWGPKESDELIGTTGHAWREL